MLFRSGTTDVWGNEMNAADVVSLSIPAVSKIPMVGNLFKHGGKAALPIGIDIGNSIYKKNK